MGLKPLVDVIGTVFTKKGTYGDFDWQILSGKYNNALFLFNDDEARNHLKKAGKGNAIIRKYNKYAMPYRPRAVGIVTGKNGEGYTSLTHDVKRAIDKTIEEAREIITKYGYTTVYYSSDKVTDDIIGTSIFDVDMNVRLYITREIKRLRRYIEWGSDDNQIDFDYDLIRE